LPDENGEEMLDDSDKEPLNQYEAKDIATYAMDITKDVIEVTKDVNCGKIIAKSVCSQKWTAGHPNQVASWDRYAPYP
jgi:hypothetical protein